MPTKWECENCGKTGIADTRKKDDVMTGYHKVKDSHAKVSPKCEFLGEFVKLTLLEEKRE